MGVLNPLYLNAVDYNAEDERRGLSGLMAQSAAGVARTGVLGAAPAVSLSGSTVQVGPFNAVVGTPKGGYLTGVDSVTPAGTIQPADQTNGRLDRVVLEVLDPDNGTTGTDRGRRLRIVTGEAKALPGLPPLPINSLHVAQIQVPRVDGGIPVVTVDCQFTAAAGAPIPVRSQAERDALLKFEGAKALRLDTPARAVDTYVGNKWILGGSAKQRLPLVGLYTPDPPRGDGLDQEAPSYYRDGRRVHLSGVASNTDLILFSGGTEYTLGNLPPDFRPQFPEYFTIEVAFTPCRVWVRPDGAVRFMFPNTIGSLGARVARFSLSGISFDAAL